MLTHQRLISARLRGGRGRRRTKRVPAGEVESADVLWWRWLRMGEEEAAELRGAIGFVEAWVVGGKNCGPEVT